MNTRRITGVSLILLAALLVASIPLSVGMLDYNPRDRDEIGGFLTWIHEHQTQYGARMALLLAKDAVVSVVVGAGLYIVFAGADRTLAALGAAGWLVATAGFLSIDGMEASMIALADDYATAGVDQAATLSVARAVAIVSGLTGQAAFSSLAVGLGSIGLLTIRHRGVGMPPVFLGWLALFATACWLLLWTSALTEAGFVFLPLGAISVIAWMLGAGLYFVRNASAGVEPADQRA